MRKAAVFRFYNSRYGSAKTGKVITLAVKYHNILLAQTSICRVVPDKAGQTLINRCSPRCSSIFRLAYEDLFCAIYCDI